MTYSSKIVIIFPFLYFGICITSTSQNYFNKLHDPVLSVASSILEEDNGYVILSQRPTYVDRQIMLMKIDWHGDSVWKNYYGNDTIIYYAQKLLKHDTGYVVAGSVKDSVNTSNFDFFLSRFDSLGNLEWIKRFGGGFYDSCKNLIKLSDGGFILVGSTVSYGPSGENFYLVKTDSFGNLIWQKTYGGGGGDDVAHRVLETPDKGFLLSGGSNSFNSDYDVYVVKTDSLGNFEWQKTYNTGFDDNSGILSPLSDGSYIIVTAYPSGEPNAKGKLIKIDLNGDIIWEEDYIYSGGRLAPYISVIENNDGTLITGGFSLPSGGNPLGYLFKTDPLGNKLWEREYYTRTDVPQYINDIISTSDNGYALCGTALPQTGINNSRTWVIKTDCFGCDSNLCYFADSACFVYDCTLFPIDAFFTSSVDTLDLAFGNTVTFTNSSLNTSARTWNFGDEENGYTMDVISHSYSQTGTYTVSLIVYHGKCTDTFTREIVVINTVGISEYGKDNSFLKAYPNPSSGAMTVEYEMSGNSPAELLVCDITGKQILSFPIGAGKGKMIINLQELEAGTYLYSLMKDGKIITSTLHLIMK